MIVESGKSALAIASQAALRTARNVRTNPDAIAKWLRKGISAPQMLRAIDDAMRMCPEIYEEGDAVRVSAEIKRRGACQ